MLHDLGSRDKTFIDVTQRMREQLLGIVADRGTHECVLLQGSGTFIVEAMIACFVPRDGKLLVLVNGAYGQRICRIAEVAGRPFSVLEWAENEPVDVVALDQALSADPAITHVTVIHCETTSGILNPIAQIADVVANHCRGLLIDSMSAFGALELDCNALPFDAVVASSNKCLEGVPGMGFCIARREALVKTQGNAQALSLDLYAQWQGFEQNGQWRFTPPVQCLLAFDQALTEFEAEGGVAGRGSRYRENRDRLVNGM
jgi:2-aminoethylphosphonate-pyruvate transaminase